RYRALATSATVAVASAVTSRSVSRSSGLRKVRLMRIGVPPLVGPLARVPGRGGRARSRQIRRSVLIPGDRTPPTPPPPPPRPSPPTPASSSVVQSSPIPPAPLPLPPRRRLQARSSSFSPHPPPVTGPGAVGPRR